jgi:hypothetical protein
MPLFPVFELLVKRSKSLGGSDLRIFVTLPLLHVDLVQPRLEPLEHLELHRTAHKRNSRNQPKFDLHRLGKRVRHADIVKDREEFHKSKVPDIEL